MHKTAWLPSCSGLNIPTEGQPTVMFSAPSYFSMLRCVPRNQSRAAPPRTSLLAAKQMAAQHSPLRLREKY